MGQTNTVEFDERYGPPSAVVERGGFYKSRSSDHVYLGSSDGKLIDLIDGHVFDPAGGFDAVAGTLTITSP